MFYLIGKAVLALILAYPLLSIISAVRMYCIHSRYVHIEFGGKKWDRFGRWAPKRKRLLLRIRKIALYAGIVLTLAVAWEVFRH